jgi:7-cyano-7-deazaguanine synthase in queuosine biosynthesis
MKIVILYSGGLDSLIMKRYAEVKHPDAEVLCVFYDIGQEYLEKEKAALPDFVIQRKLDWLGAGVSAQSKDGSTSGGIYIPGRNLVLATLVACADLPDQIWMGALLGETVPHGTDKNWEFIERTNETLAYVLSPFHPTGPKIHFPLAEAGFNKLTATAWALTNGVSEQEVLDSSSCLSGESGKCGHCVVCFRRWGIFTQLGLHEDYNVDPLSVPENQKIIYEMLYGDYYDENRKVEILPALDMIDYEFPKQRMSDETS